jgi:hypothetical protein
MLKHMMVLGILIEAKRLVTAAIVLLLSSSHLVSLSHCLNGDGWW